MGMGKTEWLIRSYRLDVLDSYLSTARFDSAGYRLYTAHGASCFLLPSWWRSLGLSSQRTV